MQSSDNGNAKQTKRERESGSIFQMHGSQNLWIKFYKNGRPVRESAGSPLRSEARKLLSKRMAEVKSGKFIGLKREKIKVAELAEDMIRDYKNNAMKSLSDLETRWKIHLKPFFGDKRAVEVSSDLVARYIDQRLEEDAKPATINRELAALKRMFSLAHESTPPKIVAIPYIKTLREQNRRTGFLDSKQHDALAASTGKIGLWLRSIFEIGYTWGWRHEELLSMRVRQVDLAAGTVRLDPGSTKNDEGRETSMTQSIKILLTQCVSGKGLDDFVFTRKGGKPVRYFRKAWANACKEAGVPGLLFHDLRRSAARNLRRAGVSEVVIMDVGGWKTRSVFIRYNIVNQSDIRDAMSSLEAKQQSDNLEAASEKNLVVGQSYGQSGTTNGASEPKADLPVLN
jgi:integrase